MVFARRRKFFLSHNCSGFGDVAVSFVALALTTERRVSLTCPVLEDHWPSRSRKTKDIRSSGIVGVCGDQLVHHAESKSTAPVCVCVPQTIVLVSSAGSLVAESGGLYVDGERFLLRAKSRLLPRAVFEVTDGPAVPLSEPPPPTSLLVLSARSERRPGIVVPFASEKNLFPGSGLGPSLASRNAPRECRP